MNFIARHFAGLIFIGIAGLLLAFGIFYEGYFMVLQKAIFICLECIGIG